MTYCPFTSSDISVSKFEYRDRDWLFWKVHCGQHVVFSRCLEPPPPPQQNTIVNRCPYMGILRSKPILLYRPVVFIHTLPFSFGELLFMRSSYTAAIGDTNKDSIVGNINLRAGIYYTMATISICFFTFHHVKATLLTCGKQFYWIRMHAYIWLNFVSHKHNKAWRLHLQIKIFVFILGIFWIENKSVTQPAVNILLVKLRNGTRVDLPVTDTNENRSGQVLSWPRQDNLTVLSPTEAGPRRSRTLLQEMLPLG